MRTLLVGMMFSLGVGVVSAGDKPGSLPAIPQTDGRVPVFPEGEQYRESQPASSEAASKPSRPRSSSIMQELLFRIVSKPLVVQFEFGSIFWHELREAVAKVACLLSANTYRLVWLPESY